VQRHEVVEVVQYVHVLGSDKSDEAIRIDNKQSSNSIWEECESFLNVSLCECACVASICMCVCFVCERR
jgi:hypothetical protein